MTGDFTGILIEMVCWLCCIWAADNFCRKYLEISRTGEALFVLLFFCGGTFLNFWNAYCAVPHIIFAFCMHMLLAGLVMLLFQGDVEKKILAASVLIAVTTLAGNFCESFFSCMTLIWLHVGKHVENPFFGECEMSLISGISLAAAAGAIVLMTKFFRSVFYSRTGKWYVLLAVPLLAVTGVIDAANWGASNGILVKSGGMGLYYDQIFSHSEICVLTALSMFAAGFYVFGMNRIYLEQRKSSQYHFQIEAYRLLEEQYSQSERLRHDLKNHVLALSGLLKNREWERMNRYLKNMAESGDFGNYEEATGSRAVDVLVNQKGRRAEKAGVFFECDVQIPKECGIHEFDLCVLFGNILDNAVEACERLQGEDREKFIHIQARKVKKCFLLEVKNSADRVLESVIGHTQKENPKEHGIGLLNVQDVVEKYNGTMHMEVQDAVFIISVLIPLQEWC